MPRHLPSLLIVLATGCAAQIDASSPLPDTRTSSEAIVGGRAETGYAAVGYTMVGPSGGAPTYEWCGATLVRPNVAITAAHCISHAPFAAPDLWLGLGPVGLGELHHVARVEVHPDYTDAPYYYGDAALLVLDADIAGVAPARLGTAASGCGYVSVGYGRVTGGGDRSDGYTWERKSAAQCVDSVRTDRLYGHGVDGGICSGDSGGALMAAGTDVLVAVHSGIFGDCSTSVSMVSTTVGALGPWIATVLGEGGEPPAAEPPPATEPAPPQADDPPDAPPADDPPGEPTGRLISLELYWDAWPSPVTVTVHPDSYDQPPVMVHGPMTSSAIGTGGVFEDGRHYFVFLWADSPGYGPGNPLGAAELDASPGMRARVYRRPPL